MDRLSDKRKRFRLGWEEIWQKPWFGTQIWGNFHRFIFHIFPRFPKIWELFLANSRDFWTLTELNRKRRFNMNKDVSTLSMPEILWSWSGKQCHFPATRWRHGQDFSRDGLFLPRCPGKLKCWNHRINYRSLLSYTSILRNTLYF